MKMNLIIILLEEKVSYFFSQQDDEEEEEEESTMNEDILSFAMTKENGTLDSIVESI